MQDFVKSIVFYWFEFFFIVQRFVLRKDFCCLLDDNFSFFLLKGRFWMMCVFVMKFRKWFILQLFWYYIYSSVLCSRYYGFTVLRLWRCWWCLVMLNLQRVRLGIYFFSILKLILLVKIEMICWRVFQWFVLLQY